MAFSGGGSNVTLPHTHDSDVVQDGGSLAANATQFGLSAGSILYSDGSNIQELAVGSAADALVVNGAGTAPSWASAGSVTLTRTLKQTSTFQSTTSTSLVDCTWSSHTLQSGSGICIAAATCQSESTAAGYLAFDFATDGTQPETWMGKPSNDLLNSCNTSMSTTLSGQVAVLQFRAQSGTAKMQSDSGYISMVNYLEIS